MAFLILFDRLELEGRENQIPSEKQPSGSIGMSACNQQGDLITRLLRE